MPGRKERPALPAEQPKGEASIGKDLLSLLPQELQLHIWQFVRSPFALSRANKRFYALSKSTLWRAKWFMQRYSRWEVIFEAIRRPKLFTAALVEQLVRLKAPLSRNLVQLLFAFRDPVLRQDFLDENYANFGKPVPSVWGTNISDASYAAVFQQAATLYGHNISFEPTEFDSYIFSQWLASSVEDERLLDRVVCFFRDFNFIPLKYEMNVGDSGPAIGDIEWKRSDQVVSAVIRYPLLARVVAANGIFLSRQEIERIMSHMDCPTKRLGAHIEGTALVDELKVEGIVNVSQDHASYSIMGLCGFAAGFEYIGSQLVQTVADPSESQDYNTLMYLEQQSALPFKMSRVVSKTLKPLLSGAVSAPMIPMVERLERDFPLSSSVSSLFVRCTFLKAERESIEDLDQIHAMMGRHQAEEADLQWACLRNGCRTTVPIRYALKWFVEGFNLDDFFEGFVEQLLMQPYRGIMLRELDRLFCESGSSATLHKRLEAAVESQAFTSMQLPPQHWDVLVDDDALDCNENAPVRSLLAFNFAGRNAKAVNLCNCKGGSHFFDTMPIIQAGVHPPRQLMTCRHREHGSETHGDRSPWLVNVTAFGGGPRRKHMPADEDYLNPMDIFCNLYGPLAEDDEPIAEVVVDLLGPQSYAADVLLSHAVVNGNASLVDSLLNVGVPLTLEHFKVALKVGYPLPTSMLEYVTGGGPFKLAFGAADVEQNGESTRLQTLVLSDAQSTTCQNISADHFNAIAVDVREDGTVLLQKLRSIRTRPASVVEASQRPSQRSRTAPRCAAWEDPFYGISNAKLWRPHLIALNYVEEQKNTIIKTAMGRRTAQSAAGVSLGECISRLKDCTFRWYGQHQPHEVACRSTAPLWAELGQVGDVALLDDVKRRVYLGMRGVRAVRQSRREAFQRSPHSYKSSKFKGTFVTDNPLTVHEPQLEPLSDEDDEDGDFTRAESEAESSDSDSDTESLSSIISEAVSDDDEDADPSNPYGYRYIAPSPAPSGNSEGVGSVIYRPKNYKLPPNFHLCCSSYVAETASSDDEVMTADGMPQPVDINDLNLDEP